MIWFGRYNIEGRLSGSTKRLAREVLDELIPLACELPADNSASQLLVELTLAEHPPTRGRSATVTFTAMARGTLAGPIEWVGPPPPPDALAACDAGEPLPFLRLDILSRSGRAVGGVLIVPDGVFTLGEIQRAVEPSLDSGGQRPARYGVLASALRPPPTRRPCQASDFAARLAVCRCENPGCPSRGGEVLVRGDFSGFSWSRPYAIAYPCPSCIGPWENRWALTWVRPATHASMAGGVVAEYRIPPTQRRRTPIANRMAIVVGSPQATAWGGWSSTTIRQIPAGMKRFLRIQQPAALRTALLDDPVLAGSLLSGLVSPTNLRAFIDTLRRMPASQRFGGVATGLAHAYCPRRPANYATPRDETQASHYQYIAYDPEIFLARLHAYGALDVRGRFLDVGCGMGEKVFLAFALGRFSQCDGLEYDAKMAAVADFLFNRIATPDRYPVCIIQGDALEFDRYGDYDVVYMYRPFREREPMSRLVRRIAAQLKPGAIMFDVIRDKFALRKAADGGLFTVATLPTDGIPAWTVPVTIDDFLNQMKIG